MISEFLSVKVTGIQRYIQQLFYYTSETDRTKKLSCSFYHFSFVLHNPHHNNKLNIEKYIDFIFSKIYNHSSSQNPLGILS